MEKVTCLAWTTVFLVLCMEFIQSAACQCDEFKSPLQLDIFWYWEGYIQMPPIDMEEYPPRKRLYKRNQTCEWNLQIDRKGYGIRLTIVKLDLQDHDDITGECNTDYVDFFDDVKGRKVLLGRNCGLDVGNTYNSTGNKMTVKFISDATLQSTGFKVKYEAVPLDTREQDEKNKRIMWLAIGIGVGFASLGEAFVCYRILTKRLKRRRAAARIQSNISAALSSSRPGHSFPSGRPAPGSSTSAVGSNVYPGERVMDSGSYSSNLPQQVALPRNVQYVPRATSANSITLPPAYSSLDFSQDEGGEPATPLTPPSYEVAIKQYMRPFSD